MKIEIKNIKVNNSFSEETTCFIADIFVDGVKVGYAKNDGQGGSTFYNSYEGKRELLNKADEYAKTLPSKFYKYGDTEMEIKSDLEGVIDDSVYKFVTNKEKASYEKKLKKNMETSICYGVPNSGKYSAIGFVGKPKIADLVKAPNGRIALTNLISKIKGELKKDEVIFNTNI
jgi:hypothetical protein